MSNSIDPKKILEKVQATLKDEKQKNALMLGTNLVADEYIKMEDWWQKSTATKGLPFGKIVQIAGTSDSGKTSAAIQGMKAAQAQDVQVIYVDTEKKTTAEDLTAWGVDPEKVYVVKKTIAEEAYNLMFKIWDAIKDADPNSKLLVIIDSIGNVVSQRDAEIDLEKESQKPGGKGAMNRLALSRMVAKMEEDNAAILLINYTYDNIGSHGKTNAGGTALNFYSSLTYQATRKAWIEKTVKGEKVRVGARVKWTLFKNHLSKNNMGPKSIEFDITSEGMKYVEPKSSGNDSKGK